LLHVVTDIKIIFLHHFQNIRKRIILVNKRLSIKF